VTIGRNRDHGLEQALSRKSAERRIDVWASFTESAEGFALTLRDGDGVTATAGVAFARQPARNADAEAALREQLARFGNTDFALHELTIACSEPRFVPASVANKLRRDAVHALQQARLAAYRRPRRRAEAAPPTAFPEQALSYLAIVYNEAARAFYARHGVMLIDAAYEAHEEAGEVSLMITRHCLRYSFNLCPKQAKGVTAVQGQVRAKPMTLVSGNERLTLRFDCRPCEMHVIGRMKKHILATPAPSSVVPYAAPVHFFRGRPAAPVAG